MRTIALIIISAIFLNVESALAQEMNECKMIIINYVKQMNSIQKPSPGKTYYMNLSMENFGNRELNASSLVMNVEVWLSANQLTYKSGQIDLFQDSLNAIAIIHPQKKIVRSKGKLNSIEETERLKFGNIQEAFIKRAAVTACRQMAWEGRDIQLIDMELHVEDQKQYKIKYLTLYFDKKEDRIFKVAISYVEGQPLVRQAITYNRIDYDYKNGKQKPVLQNIEDRKGKILPIYSRYTYIDNRE